MAKCVTVVVYALVIKFVIYLTLIAFEYTVKFLNFRTSENFAVIYLKFRKRDQTSGYFVKKMQMK